MRVMRVLRENKDSVMAVLEAFVYDPLLNWRLMDGQWTCGHAFSRYSECQLILLSKRESLG